jgi:hypothetical protein
VQHAHLSRVLRELAETLWRNGDHLRASALHARAILLEAGVDPDAKPVRVVDGEKAA